MLECVVPVQIRRSRQALPPPGGAPWWCRWPSTRRCGRSPAVPARGSWPRPRVEDWQTRKAAGQVTYVPATEVRERLGLPAR
ncbi:MAG: hypothetical protein JWN00_2948 [Actinomycetia bacterium]|nr:hypothetical protein [Actinomycetes bacterium]